MTIIDAESRPLAVWLARDHDPVGAAAPGMDLGPAELTGAADVTVARWFDDGVRKVALSDPVDLAADAADAAAVVRALVLVRELTSWGIAVEWRLRLPEDGSSWRRYSHFYPPVDVLTADGSGAVAEAGLAEWRRTFYLDKCTYRYGPGFVQVRDRREGRLNLLTIDDEPFCATLEALLPGVPTSGVDLDIVQEFAAEGLVAQVGGLLAWLPYRLRRWPLPSMVI